MTLLEAAAKFRKEFGDTVKDYLTYTVGIKEKSEFNPEDTLVIYRRKRKSFIVPETYEGFPVESHYIGKLKLCLRK